MLPDPKSLKLSTLIGNLIFASQDKNMEYRKECMLELDRRFPDTEARLLDAVKGDESSPQVTQNFVIEEDFGPIFENICRIMNHCREGRMSTTDYSDLNQLRDMFQNPATIKHKGEAD